MKNSIKRILVSLLCVTLLMGDNATLVLCSEIGDALENEIDEASPSEGFIDINDLIIDDDNSAIIEESEDLPEEELVEEVEVPSESGDEFEETEIVINEEEFTAEPLNGATYSLTYTVTNGEATITGYEGIIDNELYIPDSILDITVTTIGNSAFAYSYFNKIGVTLRLPNMLKTIEDDAFSECGFTGSLVIPNGVVTIGKRSFEGNCFTGGLIIPDSVLEIGAGAFSMCRNFDGSLSLPNYVTTIEDYTFYECGFTGDLNMPNGITRIGMGAFHGCGFDGKLALPSCVESIGICAFEQCNFSGNLDIPYGVKRIDVSAFERTGFTGDLAIPDSVSFIGDWAFFDCSGFAGNLTISNGVKSIGIGAFCKCSGFTGNLTIPDSVTSIGYSAFNNCSGFRGNLTISNSVTSIEMNTFYGCSGFTGNLTIPDSVTSIGSKAFHGCSGFRGNLIIPDSVTSIGNMAFRGCDSIVSFSIPSYCSVFEDTDFPESANIIYRSNGMFNMDYDALPFDNTASGLGMKTYYRWEMIDWIGGGILAYNKYPIERYKEVFSDFNQHMYEQTEDWKGSCFGMVIVSELFKRGLLNKELYPTNNMSEESELGKLIARYQIYQNAESYKNKYRQYSIFGSGRSKEGKDIVAGSFSDVIDRIKRGENLTISISDNKNDFTHELAVDTSRGVIETQEGWHIISLYDPNYHNNKERLLYVNTATNQWRMNEYHNSGLIGFRTDGTYIDGTSIVIYSESLLSMLPKSFNGTEKYIKSSTQNASISFSNNDTFTISSAGNRLYEYKNGECVYCAPDFEVQEILSIDYDTDITQRSGDKQIIIPSGDYVFSSSKGRLIFNGNNMYRGIVAGDGFVASVTSEGELKIQSSTTTNANVCMVNAGETEDEHTVSISTNVEISKEECAFSLKDDAFDVITSREQVFDLNVIKNDNEYVIEDISSSINKHVNLLDEPSFVMVKLYDNEISDEYMDLGDKYSKAIEINKPYGELPNLKRNNEEFVGWFTEEKGGVQVTERTICTLNQEHILYSRFVPKGLWNVKIEETEYTGEKIVPRFEVWDGLRILENNADYTITFKNNTKAYTLSEEDEGFNAKLAPSITIKSKGNYAGSETVYFKIMPADISGDTFTADKMAIKANNKAQKPVPSLLWNGKSLAAKGNYTISYYNVDETGAAIGEPLASVKDAGEYVIRLTALGTNFVGTKDIALSVTADKTLVSKLSVGKIANQTYTGSPLKPVLTIKDGKNPLTEGTDYELTYSDNTNVGKACVLIEGKGNYTGVRRVYFNITGTPLSKATVTGISTVPFTGNEIEFNDISLYIKATKTTLQKDLTEGKDYTVSYSKNVNAGTGTVIFTGINGYTGSVKKNFKITAFKLANEPDRISVEMDDSVVYSKGGTKPSVTVKFKTGDGKVKTLTEKTDYTLAYSKNTAVNDCSNPKNLPTVKITLKGSYSGSISKNYSITPKNIETVSLSVNDKTYQNKKNIYASAPALTDTDGKKLAAGKDYDKALVYTYKNETTVINGAEEVVRGVGDAVDKNDIIPAGTAIKVTATAKAGGNYSGTVSGEYRITKSSIASAKATIPAQIYSGAPITLTKDEIILKVGKDTLTSDGFEIVKGSYKNNVKKGTASLTVKGVGNYGGTKTVNFTIKTKTFIWWWKYDTKLITGADCYTVYFGVNGSLEDAMYIEDIEDYTAAQYKAVTKNKSKWKGAVVVGYKTKKTKYAVATEEVGRVVYE